MSNYRTLIAESIDGDAPPGAIEALIRMANGGVLDHLDRDRFVAESQLAAQAWAEFDAETRRFYEAEGRQP